MIDHVMCNFGINENDTEKYLDIIEYYDTAKKLFSAEYIFIRDKFI